jgi:hypothetical protein
MSYEERIITLSNDSTAIYIWDLILLVLLADLNTSGNY